MLCLLGCLLAAGVNLSAQQQAPPSALGNASVARARAHHFVAARGAAAEGADATPAAGWSASWATLGSVLPAAGASTRNGGLQLRPAVTTADLSAAWQALGPMSVTTSLYGAVTGRISAIAIDPNDPSGNTVWLGTTGGGVWRSTNAAGALGNVSFGPLTDQLPAFSANSGAAVVPSLSIGAVAVQPALPGVVLAGTGDPNDATDSYYGQGILRSADGGQTWSLVYQSNDGANGKHLLTGTATAGLAWSTSTPTLAVAAMSTSAEGGAVGAYGSTAVPGLYYTTDAGVTWQMATVYDGSQVVQQPTSVGTGAIGSPATAVVWNAQRGMFLAAISLHGYYGSTDGRTWTRLAHQPGTGLTWANCPANTGAIGSVNCPILRGALAVQPVTGDTYALTVDINNSDQGLWQDLCNAGSGGSCASAAPLFASRLDGGALEVGQGASGGSTTIAQGDYNLSLVAAPSANQGTVLLAGTLDLYRCTLASGASSCSFRNTTNAGNGCNANAKVAPAQHALAALSQSNGAPLVLIGNDGGLWRSVDGVAETGAACSSTDAGHFDNLNPAIAKGGSLAEVVGMAQDPATADTLIAGLGSNGSAATNAASALTPWPQLSMGEGGFPLIDPVNSANWYLPIGAGVNLKACGLGANCTAQDFLGSATVGPAQTSYDAALLDAPAMLDPAQPGILLTATCRVWRGVATGTGWSSGASVLSTSMDGGTTPCTLSSGFVRSLGAGGPAVSSSLTANSGSSVLYAGMAGAADGGGSVPGHLYVTKAANGASGTTRWTDVSGSTVTNSSLGFNASHFDLSSVTVDTHDTTGATVYATVMGFGGGPHVYRSGDFGAHWTNISANLPSAPVNALVVDPNDANTVYVAMDTGVYATTGVTTCTAGNCWSALGTGLPNAPVTQLAAAATVPTADGRFGMLRAGTYGRGLWQTPLLTAHSAAAPALGVAPSSLTFASQAVATISTGQTLTFTSNGNAPVTISSVRVTGDFVESDSCSGQTIAVGSTCTAIVRFAPTAVGTRTGLLTVFGDVAGGQATVTLNGTGGAAASVVLTPVQLTYAATVVNQTTAAQIITVSNTGGTPTTIGTPSLSGDFALTANTCGSSLASQTGCSLAITFTPTATGTRTGVLSVPTGAGMQSAVLSGIGNGPATDTLSPSSLSFGQQPVGTTSTSQQITLSNSGDVALMSIKVAVVSGDFVAVNTCGNSLAAHSTCAITVSFAPTDVGTRTGSLQVTDQFRTQTVSMSGSGLAPAGVSLAPATLAFDATGVGMTSAVTTVTLTNSGGVPLTQLAAVVAGDFAISSTSCGVPLAAGASCTYLVVFKPTAAGTRAGTLTLTDDAPGGKQAISLGGTGVDFSLQSNGPSSITVSSGTTATFPLILNSQTGLTGDVAMACSGAPANTVCTVTPGSGALGGTVLVSVTVQTGTTKAISSLRTGEGGRSAGWLLLGGPLFAGVFPARRRWRGSLRGITLALGLAGVFAATAMLTGCGASRLIPLGGSGTGTTGTTGTTTQTPTTPGSYNLLVTGSAAGLSRTVPLTLVVQ